MQSLVNLGLNPILKTPLKTLEMLEAIENNKHNIFFKLLIAKNLKKHRDSYLRLGTSECKTKK